MLAGFVAGQEPLAAIDLALHGYWYLGRAAGLVGVSVLFFSAAFGLSVSSRLLDDLIARAWLFELHRFVSLFVLVVVLFHALIMLPDPYAGFTVADLLVPFQSHFARVPVAIGIISFYGLAVVSLSFFITRWIGQRTWRLLHYLTFVLLAATMVHATWAGTDSESVAVRLYYLALGSVLLFMVFYRILAARGSARRNVAVRPF